MNDILWLLGGNIIFWAGLGAYAIFLGASQKRIERQIKQLEILTNDDSE